MSFFGGAFFAAAGRFWRLPMVSREGWREDEARLGFLGKRGYMSKRNH